MKNSSELYESIPVFLSPLAFLTHIRGRLSPRTALENLPSLIQDSLNILLKVIPSSQLKNQSIPIPRTNMSQYSHKVLNKFLQTIESDMPDVFAPQRVLTFQLARSFKNQLQTSSYLVNSFFMIGFAAFKLEKLDFLEDLWQTKASMNALESVPSDLEFNIRMIYDYLNGGIFGHNPAEETLFVEYCFLYLSYALRKSSTGRWVPTMPDFETKDLYEGEFSEELRHELKWLYLMLVNLQYILEKLLPAYASIHLRSASFDTLFSGKASDVFDSTKVWLDTSSYVVECKKASSALVLSLPLDHGIVQKISETAQTSYLKLSQIARLGITNLEAQTGPILKELVATRRIETHETTLLGSGQFDENLGFQLNHEAITFLTRTILDDHQIQHLAVDQLDFHEIEAAVQSLVSAEVYPTLLLVDNKILRDACRYDARLMGQISTNFNGDRILKVNEKINLLILESFKGSIEQAVIFSKELGEWKEISMPVTKIRRSAKDALISNVTVRKNVSYKIVEAKSAVILDIST